MLAYTHYIGAEVRTQYSLYRTSIEASQEVDRILRKLCNCRAFLEGIREPISKTAIISRRVRQALISLNYA